MFGTFLLTVLMTVVVIAVVKGHLFVAIASGLIVIGAVAIVRHLYQVFKKLDKAVGFF